MNKHSFFWFPILLALVVSIGIGTAAYNAGVAHGLALNPNAAGIAAAWGLGWHPWFHPFGFLFPLFFLFFFMAVARRAFGGGGWRRHGAPPAWSDRFDQWHREAHERMNRPV